jgi:hypothetical protein
VNPRSEPTPQHAFTVIPGGLLNRPLATSTEEFRAVPAFSVSGPVIDLAAYREHAAATDPRRAALDELEQIGIDCLRDAERLRQPLATLNARASIEQARAPGRGGPA